MNCACMSVGNAGVRRGLHVDCRERPIAADANHVSAIPSVLMSMVAPRLAQLLEHGLERDRPARRARRHRRPLAADRGEKRSGLDPVGHDRVRRAVQAGDAFDRDPVAARAGDARAHRA